MKAPRLRSRLPRLGLAVRLYVAIGGAVILTLVASVVAWLSFVELGQSQQHITATQLPAITQSLRLANQSALIAATAPRLLTAEDEDRRAALMRGLEGQLEELQTLAGDLERLLADETRDDTLEDGRALATVRFASSGLGATLADLGQTVGRQLALNATLRERVGAAVEGHRRLVEALAPLIDDAAFFLVTGYATLDDPAPVAQAERASEASLARYTALSDVAAEANLLVGLLTEALSVPSVALLQPLRERFDASADRFVTALAGLAALPEHDELRREFTVLELLGERPGGVIDLRRQILEQSAHAQALLQRSRDLATQLTDEVERIVERAQEGTLASVADANESIESGRRLLLLLNALSIVGATLLGWVYVKRAFTTPVLHLTAAAETFERQRFDPATLADTRRRSDELGHLARVFTRMAEEVQARTDTLDRLVAERTAELHAKNRALEQSLKQIADELAMAQRMQLSILPRRYPILDSLALFARMRAARVVGGDFYDIIELDDHRVGIVIADVSDKGVPAALLMAVACTKIKTIAMHETSASRVLEELNRTLAQDNETAMFVTVFYGIVDHQQGLLTYANGGHDAPFLLRGSRPADPLPRTGGVALGLMADLTYDERSLPLEPGDTIFFYTDGVTEAFNTRGDAFTALRLKDVLFRGRGLSVEALGRQVIEDVEAYTEGAPQSDDITCVVIRYRPELAVAAAPDPRLLVFSMAADLAELSRLAEAVEAFGETNAVPTKVIFQLNLALDELLTNTINYGCRDGAEHHIEVRLRRSGQFLELVLQDDAAPFNPLDAPPPDLDKSLEDRPIGGLGVHLVRTMMDSVDYERTVGGNRLVLRKRLDEAAGGAASPPGGTD